MKTHVICERDVGLFSLIQQVIAHIPWAAQAGRAPIVVFADRCCYWHREGYRDRSTVWEYYFEPLDSARPAASVPAEVRADLAKRFPDPREIGFWIREDTWVSNHFGDHRDLKGKTLSIPYTWSDPQPALRARAASLIREHVRPRKYLREKVDAFFDQKMGGHNVIGVQIRGTDAVSSGEDRAHRKDSLSLENYRRELQPALAAMPDARLFVATDDQRSLDFMRREFGERVLAYESHRHREGEAAGRGPTGCIMPAYIADDPTLAARNGEEAVIEYLLLSRCALLVHNGSSLARTVLLTHPDLPHINTHRKSPLLAHLQTVSVKKLRRHVKRALWRAKARRRGASADA